MAKHDLDIILDSKKFNRLKRSYFAYIAMALFFLITAIALVLLFFLHPFIPLALVGLAVALHISAIITKTVIMVTLLAGLVAGIVTSFTAALKQLYNSKFSPLTKRINDLLREVLKQDYFISSDNQDKIKKQLSIDIPRAAIYINGQKLTAVNKCIGAPATQFKIGDQEKTITLDELLAQCPVIPYAQQNILHEWYKTIIAESSSTLNLENYGTQILPNHPQNMNYKFTNLGNNKWRVTITAVITSALSDEWLFAAPNNTESQLVLLVDTKNKDVKIEKRDVPDFSKYTFSGFPHTPISSNYTFQDHIKNGCRITFPLRGLAGNASKGLPADWRMPIPSGGPLAPFLPISGLIITGDKHKIDAATHAATPAKAVSRRTPTR